MNVVPIASVSKKYLGHEWDSSQHDVLFAPASERQIVDAGPGCGKTAVACARIAHIIKHERIPPSRIWMVSFTRAAVAEVRNRLMNYAGDDAATVRIKTLDQHAWSLNAGLDPEFSNTPDYSDSIIAATRLIEENSDLSSYLARLQHLIIDESQDIVGIRSEFVQAMLSKLSPDCGVTVFGDPVQSIFGFTNDNDDQHESGSRHLFSELSISQRDDGSFKSRMLTTVHRTEQEGLLEIFGDVRKKLLDAENSPDSYDMLLDEISRNADKVLQENGLQQIPRIEDLDIEELERGDLVLLRSRSEVIQASHSTSIPHSVRMGDYGGSLPAWIGICFQYEDRDRCARDDFRATWETSFGEDTFVPLIGPDEAWDLLVSIAGETREIIDMRRLRSVLSRSQLPAEIVEQDHGLPGPTISTIHASKGREADLVAAMASRGSNLSENADPYEEAKLLFVAATRAKRVLYFGTGYSYRGWPSRPRVCKKTRYDRNYMVEMGKESDFNAESVAGRSFFDEKSFKQSQSFLEKHAGLMTTGLQVSTSSDLEYRYKLHASDSDTPICFLTERFGSELWKVAKALSNGRSPLRPPHSFNHVRMMGSRTIVLARDDPELDRLCSPATRSGFMLAPKLVGFGVGTFGRWRHN